MGKCEHVILMALLAILFLIGDILSFQSVNDIGTEDPLVSDRNLLESRLSAKIRQLVQDTKTSTELPAVGIDLRFFVPYYYEWLVVAIIGYTGSWSHHLLGSSAIEDDFTIEFINVEGDFLAKLRIQASRLKVQGKYQTDLKDDPTFRSTPNITFDGNRRYDMSLNSFEFFLQVEGRAPPVGNVSIISAKISIDFKNPDVNFTNLSLISHAHECIKSQIELSCLNTNKLQVFLPDLNDDQNGINVQSVPSSSISNKVNGLHHSEVAYDDHVEFRLLNTQISYPTVKNLASRFAATFQPDGSALSSQPDHFVSTASLINPDHPINIPDIETQVLYRNQDWDSFGGYLRIRSSTAIGFDGQENIFTEFIDENGAFIANYSLTFPILIVSGFYETDLTLYLSISDRTEGQGRLFGSGDYNWELKNVSLKISARGRAPIDGASKITVSNVSVEMSHENHYTRQGLNFTNMTSELWSFNGTLGMHVRPYNWHQVIQDHRFLLEDFFYNVRYGQRPLQDTFKDSVAQQLQCALNYTLNVSHLTRLYNSGITVFK
ncbi:hypothetical protein Fcan01_00996 [Folsomia candida]|uniref:Uncharacterized protein n=1 Tax=Folsomia candida TaxID=158441 RepID=A0A226EW56_FOLCA|nr:hypothetical protein Fcan01_00996 [Folsomia candida]